MLEARFACVLVGDNEFGLLGDEAYYIWENSWLSGSSWTISELPWYMANFEFSCAGIMAFWLSFGGLLSDEPDLLKRY